MPGNPLIGFVDKKTVVPAAWANGVDILVNAIFQSAVTNPAARAALCSDAPLEIVNGGTAGTSAAVALANLGGIGPSYVNQQNTGTALYSVQTALEAAALPPITPPAPWYPPGDVRRYGWTATTGNPVTDAASALSNAQAILNAIAGGGAGLLNNGVQVILPPGAYPIAPVAIPFGQCVIRGSGVRTTYLQWNNTVSPQGSLFLFGTPGTNVYGSGLSDLTVQITGTIGTAVYLMGTIGAEVSRVYVEGETIAGGRTTSAVVIDGGNVVGGGAFFNHIRDVEGNHMHNVITMTSTGVGQTTQNYFTNVNGTGDRTGGDTTSVGILLGNGSVGAAQFSVFTACDMENFGTGLHVTALAGACTFIGMRTENNTTDYQFDANSNGNTFVGGNPVSIVDSTNLPNNIYLGCTGAGGLPLLNALFQAQFTANGPAAVAGSFIGYPGSTADLLDCMNSSLTKLFRISNIGAPGFYGQAPPSARTNGYGTPTGNAVQGSFAAGSITLPNLAAAVAQLILDLKATGVIGA